MRTLLIIMFAQIFTFTQAQTIDFSAGYNLNRYFGGSESGNSSTYFTAGSGYVIGIGIRDLINDSARHLNPYLSVTFAKTTGQAELSSTYHVAGGSYDFKAKEYLLAFNFALHSIKINKSFYISPGLSINHLVNYEIEGIHQGWGLNSTQTGFSSYSYEMTRENTILTQSTLGLFVNLENKFKLNDRLFLSPRITYYYGIFSKFEFYSGVSAMQLHGTLSLSYALK